MVTSTAGVVVFALNRLYFGRSTAHAGPPRLKPSRCFGVRSLRRTVFTNAVATGSYFNNMDNVRLGRVEAGAGKLGNR